MTFVPIIFTNFRQIFGRIATTATFSRRSIMSINDLISEHIEEVSSGNGECVYLFKVNKPHLNQSGNLHGGVTASLVDVVTTYALMSANKPAVGVSVDLCVSRIFRRFANFNEANFRNCSSKNNGFTVYDLFENNLKEISAQNGDCVCNFKVGKSHLNRIGSLHGGVTAMLVDIVTTRALKTAKYTSPGVSIDLSISYVGAAKEGDELLIEAKTVKSGRTLAFIDAIVRRKTDNAVIATGKHTKFVQIGNL